MNMPIMLMNMHVFSNANDDTYYYGRRSYVHNDMYSYGISNIDTIMYSYCSSNADDHTYK